MDTLELQDMRNQTSGTANNASEAMLLAATIIYYTLGVFVGGIFVALSFHVRSLCVKLSRGTYRGGDSDNGNGTHRGESAAVGREPSDSFSNASTGASNAGIPIV